MSNTEITTTVLNSHDGEITLSSLERIAQINVASINGLSNQMGLLNDRMEEIVRRQDSQDSRITGLERNTIVNRAEKRQIRKAVMNRVNTVLKIKFDGGKVADESISTDTLYRGGFISRCYTDAKNHSKMGESYAETLKVDFQEVLDYINAWTPEVEGGVEGYKHYLDIRREERNKNKQ